MPRPRILILGKLPPPFMGPSVMTATILGSSLKDRFELLHFDSTLNQRLGRIGKMTPGKAFRLYAQYRRLRRELKRHRPDLALIPLSQTPFGLSKDLHFVHLVKRAGVKALGHLHGGELDRTIEGSPSWLRPSIERRLHELDGAIVLGDGLRRIFEPYLPEERIHTVPNGLDLPFASDLEHPDPPPFRILFLSNPIRRKGVEDAIEAIRLLHERGKAIRLDIAGEWFEPDLEGKCKAWVEEKELPVCFHPPCSGKAKSELLEKAHLFLLPPREPEGLPVALIEALAYGLPIFSTEQGAIPEAVEDGVNGALLPPKDPQSIALRTEELIETPERRKAFGRASRERYEARFNEERLCENLYHCFNSLLTLPFRA